MDSTVNAAEGVGVNAFALQTMPCLPTDKLCLRIGTWVLFLLSPDITELLLASSP